MPNASAPGAAIFHMFFDSAHHYLERIIDGLEKDVLRWSPRPGPASILGQYAHIVASEDWLVNVKARAAVPLMATSYAGNTGFQTPPPITGWDEWAHTETIDFSVLRNYARAVFHATADYLASVNDDALNRPIDLSEIGLREATAGYALVLAASNCAMHTGEISALKGLCGLTGYHEIQKH